MPRGKGKRFTSHEHDVAMHVKETYLKKGLSEEEAERRAWATVSKMRSGHQTSLRDLKRK